MEAAVADTRPLLRVAGLVQHLLAQAALPRGTAGTADYSVQWLDLRVLPPSQRAQPQPL